MTHYIAIVEEEPGRAVGVRFPDLPGCFSAGDTLDEAMVNAREALSAWAEHVSIMPNPRTLTELRDDPEVASDIETYMVAVIPFERSFRIAAE